MNIKNLVKKYTDNRAYYLTSQYNESQVRIDFLDPFFELMGWDINNKEAKSTNEREVLLEEALKEDTYSSTKKPDYTFRLFSKRKFFLEAKKPYVKIEVDEKSAKQVRRYGFTAKLKISILSNFEYLAIYDCSKKVEQSDLATNSRIKLYHYTEYIEKFDEIKNQLSREIVYNGKFDIVWKDIEEQLKLFSIDKLFLEHINDWRTLLGKEIYSHKPSLNEEELNDIVQSYINSIIFLRVCEDRNLEIFKTLFNLAENENINALIAKFRESDTKYNAGLFNYDLIEEIIQDNSSSFWIIIKQLYFPESTYSFSVFASDILGSIYEIFLAEQLKIIDNKIVLTKKPEHIDRDIVTTPTFVIHDILRKTISEYCVGKSDIEILNSTFADIACGSGAFLLEIYQLLHDILVDYYLIHDKCKIIQISQNSFKLDFDIKKQILENCIYGVDKDFNAVEASKFGLLLKLLENENNTTISKPALPNLDKNIQFGNSLISSNEIDEEEFEIINPFNFGDTKFDIIVGNPPYMSTEHIKKFTPIELPLYKSKFLSAYKQFDKYFLFIEKGLNLLKKDGYLGYIIPNKFFKVASGKNLRNLLVNAKYIKEIISFGANQIFDDKTTYTCLLILQKNKQKNIKYHEVTTLKDWKTRNFDIDDFDIINFNELHNDSWVLVSGNLKSLFKKINTQSITLENLIGSDNIYNGIQTSANPIYIHTITYEDKDYLYFMKDGNDWKIEKDLTKPYFKTSKGKDNLYTYRPLLPNSFVIYPYIKINEEIKFVEIEQLKIEFPYAYQYLLYYKNKLNNNKRDIKPIPETSDEWYRYGRHQSLDKCDVPAKIIVGVLSQGDKYAIDYNGTLISSGGTAGYCMITLPDDCKYSIYYIQALLNSKYLEWFSSLIGEVFRGGYIARGTKILKKLPIRIIDFNNLEDKLLHDNITIIQKRLIEIQNKMDKNIGNNRKLTILQKQFNNTKIKLNNLLKILYNLQENDILIPLISDLYAID